MARVNMVPMAALFHRSFATAKTSSISARLRSLSPSALHGLSQHTHRLAAWSALNQLEIAAIRYQQHKSVCLRVCMCVFSTAIISGPFRKTLLLLTASHSICHSFGGEDKHTDENVRERNIASTFSLLVAVWCGEQEVFPLICAHLEYVCYPADGPHLKIKSTELNFTLFKYKLMRMWSLVSASFQSPVCV